MPFPGRLAHKAKIPDGGGSEHAPGIPVPGVPVGPVHWGAALGAIPIDFPFAPRMGGVGGLVTGGGEGVNPVTSGGKKALGIPKLTGPVEVVLAK